MKNLKTTLTALLLLAAFGLANAKTSTNGTDKLSADYTVSTYVNAIVHGQTEGVDKIIDPNMKFSFKRGEQMLNYDKDQAIAFIKLGKGVDQDCSTKISVNEINPELKEAKIELKYKDFTRVNYITMAHGANGWQITNIYSTFN